MNPVADRPAAGAADDPQEAALAAALRSPDPAAFEFVVRATGARLLAVARRLLADEEEARDALQEAFIHAFRARHTFTGASRVSTWLHRIAINASLMRLRSRRRHPEQSIDDLLPAFLEDGHHRERFNRWSPAEEALSREETRALVRRAIDRLPENYRTVLILRDLEDLDTEQTAALLGITANAAKIRLHRARLALRTLIAPLMESPR